MNNFKEYINVLGHLAKDKITNFEGVITSIAFDLYGCIQVIVTSRKVDDKGESAARWFDINRLDIDYVERIMECPFETRDLPENTQKYMYGPAEKPNFTTMPLK